MHPWNITVKTTLETLANSADALQMQAYMRNQFLFLGIQSTQRRDALKPLFSKEQLPEIDDLPRLSESFGHFLRGSFNCSQLTCSLNAKTSYRKLFCLN